METDVNLATVVGTQTAPNGTSTPASGSYCSSSRPIEPERKPRETAPDSFTDSAPGSPASHAELDVTHRTRAIATAVSCTAKEIAQETSRSQVPRRIGWLGLNAKWAPARREGRVTTRLGQCHRDRRKARRTSSLNSPTGTLIEITVDGRSEMATVLVLTTGLTEFEISSDEQHMHIRTTHTDCSWATPLTGTHEVVCELAAQAEPEPMNGLEAAGILTQRITALRLKLAGCFTFGPSDAAAFEESSSHFSEGTSGLEHTNELMTQFNSHTSSADHIQPKDSTRPSTHTSAADHTQPRHSTQLSTHTSSADYTHSRHSTQLSTHTGAADHNSAKAQHTTLHTHKKQQVADQQERNDYYSKQLEDADY
jgi:hypothetical protein